MCPRRAYKAGLCEAHYYRRRRGKKPLAEAVGKYEREPSEGLYRAALEYANATEGSNAEFWRARERFRHMLRRVLAEHLARLTGVKNRRRRDAPRVVRREHLPDGSVRVTFRSR